MGSLVGPRDGLDVLRVKQIVPLQGIESRFCQMVASRNADWAIRLHITLSTLITQFLFFKLLPTYSIKSQNMFVPKAVGFIRRRAIACVSVVCRCLSLCLHRLKWWCRQGREVNTNTVPKGHTIGVHNDQLGDWVDNGGSFVPSIYMQRAVWTRVREKTFCVHTLYDCEYESQVTTKSKCKPFTERDSNQQSQ
jgi:hypothetical protein